MMMNLLMKGNNGVFIGVVISDISDFVDVMIFIVFVSNKNFVKVQIGEGFILDVVKIYLSMYQMCIGEEFYVN